MKLHSINSNTLRSKKLAAVMKTFPDCRYEISDIPHLFFMEKSSDVYVDWIADMSAILLAQKKIFQKIGVMLTLDSFTRHDNYFDAFKSIDSGEVSYEAAFRIAFEVAALQYLWDRQHSHQIDEVTIALLCRGSVLTDISTSGNATTFRELSMCMMDTLRGTTYSVDDDYNYNMGDLASSDEFLLYLLLQRMDGEFVKLHEAFFNALVSNDVAVVNKLITVK